MTGPFFGPPKRPKDKRGVCMWVFRIVHLYVRFMHTQVNVHSDMCVPLLHSAIIYTHTPRIPTCVSLPGLVQEFSGRTIFFLRFCVVHGFHTFLCARWQQNKTFLLNHRGKIGNCSMKLPTLFVALSSFPMLQNERVKFSQYVGSWLQFWESCWQRFIVGCLYAFAAKKIRKLQINDLSSRYLADFIGWLNSPFRTDVCAIYEPTPECLKVASKLPSLFLVKSHVLAFYVLFLYRGAPQILRLAKTCKFFQSVVTS